MLSSWKLYPHVTLNNVEHYSFITFFSGKFDTPHHHLRYITPEWPLKPQNIFAVMLNCSQYHDTYRLTYNGDVIAFADTVISAALPRSVDVIKAWRFSIADHTIKLANPSRFSCSPFSAFGPLSIWYCLEQLRFGV